MADRWVLYRFLGKKKTRAMYEPLVPDIIHIPYGKIEKLEEIISMIMLLLY